MAVICNAQDWEEIENFGNARKDFFSKYLDLKNGIPSHDTFNRFFSLYNPKYFQTIFIEGALVSINAMGCQKEITTEIIKGQGDYLLAVKGNQKTLYEDIKSAFMVTRKRKQLTLKLSKLMAQE